MPFKLEKMHLSHSNWPSISELQTRNGEPNSSNFRNQFLSILIENLIQHGQKKFSAARKKQVLNSKPRNENYLMKSRISLAPRCMRKFQDSSHASNLSDESSTYPLPAVSTLFLSHEQPLLLFFFDSFNHVARFKHSLLHKHLPEQFTLDNKQIIEIRFLLFANLSTSVSTLSA